MGCTASKLDNEDTVRRCKDRRRLMKDAVYARHHLAAAHAEYCRSLRVTGSALSSFAAGEPLSVSDQTPAVLLRTSSSSSFSHSKFTTTATAITPPPPIPFPSTSIQPPPPPPYFSPSPSLAIASSKLPHILSSSSISSTSSLHQNRLHRKPVKPPMKLPHILSESSPSSSQQSHHNYNPGMKNYTYNAQSTYSSTPSQASSVWNWENFYPPSPPDSEYFELHKKRNEEDRASTYSFNSNNSHRNPYPHDDYERYDHHHHLDTDVEHEETEREEVQCSEWGDHYSSTTTSSSDEDSRSEVGTRSNLKSSVLNGPNQKLAATPSFSESRFSGRSKSDDAGSSTVSGHGGNGEIADMRIVVRHKDLAEIVAAITEYFDKAASAGEHVSEILETGRAQLDRSFKQLKKTVYHSSGVMSNLSSSWTSKPPLAVKYRFEPSPIDESGGSKSLCSTLERLLAWEKKLYQEVKVREGVKIEHEKKLSALQSQEYRGGEQAKLDKTKASIKRLQSLITVTSEAVSTTSSAIIGLRDGELIPQLVELCHGFMYMWRSMNQFHEGQNDIVQQVRGLINRSTKGESTSDLHRHATRDLESAVSSWHYSFCRLVKFQRDFLRSIHVWFKLTLFPINSEPSNCNREPSEAYGFCDEWKLALDRLPDTVASEAIKSFINVVHSISLKQTEELKVKKQVGSASKELEKKASSLRNIEKKYYNSYSMVGIGLQDTGPGNGYALDACDPLVEKRSELAACQRRLEDEMLKHSKAVEVTRAMTLNNIQTGLPGVFQAMTSFSALIVEALEIVCTRSYAIK